MRRTSGNPKALLSDNDVLLRVVSRRFGVARRWHGAFRLIHSFSTGASITLLVPGLLFAAVPALRGQATSPPTMRAVRIPDRSIKIDGELDEQVWQTAEPAK